MVATLACKLLTGLQARLPKAAQPLNHQGKPGDTGAGHCNLECVESACLGLRAAHALIDALGRHLLGPCYISYKVSEKGLRLTSAGAKGQETSKLDLSPLYCKAFRELCRTWQQQRL